MLTFMTDIEIRRGTGHRLAPMLLLLSISCSGPGAGGPRVVAPATPASQPATRPVSLHVTVDQLQKSDKDLPRARALPTISAIDFTGFPAVSSGAYGTSKRQVLVKPGKPGVIAEALAAAAEGDTILLEQGIYREGEDGDDGALRITKPGVILRSLPGKRARVLPRAAGTKRGVLISADNVMVHGLTLEGFTSTGVAIGREGATVRGVIISEVTIKAGKGDWVDGIVVWPDNRALKKPASAGLLIRNVTIEGANLGVSCGASFGGDSTRRRRCCTAVAMRRRACVADASPSPCVAVAMPYSSSLCQSWPMCMKYWTMGQEPMTARATR